MLGRTDSRRRLLFLLVCFFLGSLALVTRTAYWQIGRADSDWAGTGLDKSTIRLTTAQTFGGAFQTCREEIAAV